MNDILNAVNKDSVIKACKKRAKEILKTHPNKELTLMQCLDLAAKDMKFSSWYELRTNRKTNVTIAVLKEQINPKNKFDSLLNKYFMQDYETLHFEIRDSIVEIKGRKYGVMEKIIEDFSGNMINEVLLNLNIDIENYGWLSTPTYNIQTMPVYSFNKQKSYYDVIVVKKDEFEVKAVKKEKVAPHIQANKPTENTLTDKLTTMGFNEQNINDIKENFIDKNIFIAGITGSGKSKTAEIIANELKQKGLKVILVEEVGNVEQLDKNMLTAIKSDVDYIYIPETRTEHMASWLNKIVQTGHKIITTIHSHNIDGIYSRIKSLGFTEFDYNDHITNNLFIYQEMVSLLCNDCKEKEFSFKKVVQHTAFMNYVNKYEQHENAENNMYKRSNSHTCKNPKCHHGLAGRKIIAETYNIYKDNNNNYVKNIINHSRYLPKNTFTEDEMYITHLKRVREGKVSDYLRTMSIDCQSNRYLNVLKGEIEL